MGKFEYVETSTADSVTWHYDSGTLTKSPDDIWISHKLTKEKILKRIAYHISEVNNLLFLLGLHPE